MLKTIQNLALISVGNTENVQILISHQTIF